MSPLGHKELTTPTTICDHNASSVVMLLSFVCSDALMTGDISSIHTVCKTMESLHKERKSRTKNLQTAGTVF